MRITIMALAAALVTGPALADDPFDLNQHPNPDAARRITDQRAVVGQCKAVYDKLFDRVAAERDKVFHYAYDYNAKDGYIKNSPLNIYMRDTRAEMDRLDEEFRHLYHRDSMVVDDCIHVAYKYMLRFDCFYQHTTANDVPGMRTCSDIYDTYVDADRYYGGKPPE